MGMAREKFINMKLRDSGKSAESRECRLERNDSPPEHLFEDENESIWNVKNILIFLMVFIGLSIVVVLIIYGAGGFSSKAPDSKVTDEKHDPMDKDDKVQTDYPRISLKDL